MKHIFNFVKMLTSKHFFVSTFKVTGTNQGLLHAKRLRLNDDKDHVVFKLKNGDTEWLQGKYNPEIPKIFFIISLKNII